jgi:hypothetical protein
VPVVLTSVSLEILVAAPQVMRAACEWRTAPAKIAAARMGVSFMQSV